jgi:sporulation protein YlmC with PRC-barrel domain
MSKLASTATALLFALSATVATAQTPQPAPQATPASAAAQILATLPASAMTITHWYKQSVYDPSDAKIGEIMDVLADRDGKIVGMIVGVGGFLGVGEKDVAVPFNAVQFKTKDNNKWYPVMNTTKDALKNAPGYKYDRTAMTWVPENAPATTGSRPAPAPQPNAR